MKTSVRTHDERLARRVLELARLATIRTARTHRRTAYQRKRLAEWAKDQRRIRVEERIGIAATRAATKAPPNRVLRRRRHAIARASRQANRR
jgi:hypothetical protein